LGQDEPSTGLGETVNDAPQPGLQIKGDAQEGRHTLWLKGELDLVSAGMLETRIGELCTDGASLIVLEMGELGFMDSTGLRSLLVSQELCAVNSCRLLIGELSAQVARLLELSGLEGRLPRATQSD
jgi:anti-anti-sigma factor